jgi:hypothetical protein
MKMAYVIIAVLLGIVARTVLPYLQTLRDNPDTPFDRKFFMPAVITVLMALLTSPLVFAAIPADQLNAAVTFQGLILLFVAGWGATDVCARDRSFSASKAQGRSRRIALVESDGSCSSKGWLTKGTSYPRGMA